MNRELCHLICSEILLQQKLADREIDHAMNNVINITLHIINCIYKAKISRIGHLIA